METQETVNLAVEMDGVAVEVDEISTHHSDDSGPPGRIIGYLSSHGEVLAAFNPSDAQDTVLAPSFYKPTARVDLDPVTVALDLEQYGFAYSMEERDVGTCAVAAPIRDQIGTVVASVAVLAQPGRFGPKQRQSHARAVKTTANAISISLGYLSREEA